MDEPRRVVGTEQAVRIDGEIRMDRWSPGTPIPFKYEITNQRGETIAVAEMVPVTSYDPESRTVTVTLGSEVPGEQTLPNLIAIAPGEKKAFTATARIAAAQLRTSDPLAPDTFHLRLKLNFLGDAAPFRELVGMQEKAVVDPKRADELFPLWLEKNEAVYTNALPVRIGEGALPDASPVRRRPFPSRQF